MHDCIEQFGPGRCMFESNFTVDKVSYSYNVLYNAFKRPFPGLLTCRARGLVPRHRGACLSTSRLTVPFLSSGLLDVARLTTLPRRRTEVFGYQKKMLTFLGRSTFWSRTSFRRAIFHALSTRRKTSRRAPT
jgi:hypothetical protein